MSIDQIINLLAMITLLEMMVSIGLGVSLPDVLRVAGDWRLLVRAAVANYILVPAAAVALVLLFRAHPLVAAGFVVVAVCPGAPYGPPFTSIARGNVATSVGLMAVLAGSSAILAPLLLGLLLPLIAGDEPIRIDALKIVAVLALGQLLPLCLGLFVRQRNPGLAHRLRKPAAKVSTLLNLVLVCVIVGAQYPMLAAIRPAGYLGMLLLLLACMLAGWTLGVPGRENRKTMTITTAVRNVGVGLVIASGSFAGTPAVTAATAYGLFQLIAMALVAMAWGRATSSGDSAGPDPVPRNAPRQGPRPASP